MPGTVSAILWGPTYENVLRIPYPLDNVSPRRRPRPGSTRDRLGDGTYVTWIEGRDYVLDAELRWTPWGDTSDPLGTGWSGPLGVEEFLSWAPGNLFRFVPDATVPDFYVDACSLMEPFEDPRRVPEQDGTFRLPISITNAVTPFSRALRGIMFEYAPGMYQLDPAAATFSRATAATRRGLPGSLAAAIGASDAAGVLRESHYEGALRTTLLEQSTGAQLITSPEDFSAWTNVASPVLTPGQPDPFGGTNAYLIEDNDAAADEGKAWTVTGLVGDGSKPGSVFIRQGTATVSRIVWWFGGAVTRLSLTATWDANGVPNVVIDGGLGSIDGVIPMGGGWYLVRYRVSGVLDEEANVVRHLGAMSGNAPTGSTYYFGSNVWNSGVATSYQGPSLAFRERDSLVWPFLHVPQAMFMYAKFVERGTALSGATNKGILHLGAAGVGARMFDLNCPAGSAPYRVTHGHTATGFIEAQLGAVPALNAVVELMGLLFPDGHVQIRQSIDGGAETSVTNVNALALAAAWSAQQLRFNQRDAASTGWAAFANVKLGALTFGGQTIDTIAKARAA